jgi:Raf kinase inhibitor-like YbhB/YbcL family protein
MSKKLIIIFGIGIFIAGFILAQLINRRQLTYGNNVSPTVSPSLNVFTLRSNVFQNYGQIPVKYTCDGENISPPLQISNVPEKTVSLTLIIDDIDAPTGSFVHWLVWNIDPKTTTIEAGETPPGVGIGVNDFRDIKYGGPCPQTGEHKYLFTLYALDKYLVFTEKTNKNQVIDAMNTHIISKTEMVGTFER